MINQPKKPGHVFDAATGLVQAQQRYLDTESGRFVSGDAVAARAIGDNFNRYFYANNNPYKFIDPDGRETAMFQHSRYRMAQPDPAAATAILGFIADFTPVVGDAKGIYEAWQQPTWSNIAAAGVGLVPIVGDAGGKLLKYGGEVAGTATVSPTAGKRVDAATRERILARDQNADGSWTCATCGKGTTNAENVHTGHVVPRSKGGDLSNANLRCKGAACNLSQGNREAPRTGMTCAERGSCGAPYGRSD